MRAAALQFPVAPGSSHRDRGAATPMQVRENVELFQSDIPTDLWTELKAANLLPETRRFRPQLGVAASLSDVPTRSSHLKPSHDGVHADTFEGECHQTGKHEWHFEVGLSREHHVPHPLLAAWVSERTEPMKASVMAIFSEPKK